MSRRPHPSWTSLPGSPPDPLLTRRAAIKAVGLSAAAGALGGFWGCSRRPSKTNLEKPNILLIIGDDHRWDTLSCLHHPIAKTPNLDRLAAEGTLFENYFATTSLCAPSRASILTGLRAHQHQVFDNGRANLGDELQTFSRLLQGAGYRTSFIGKWHIGNSERKPGFDYWLSFPGQGDYIGGQLIENDRRFKSEGHITDVLSHHAIEWLRKGDQRPFCMVMAHKAAHYPFKPAQRHQRLFNGMPIPEPVSWSDSLESKPVWQRAAFDGAWARMDPQGAYSRGIPTSFPPREWKPEELQRGWLGYYRVIFGLDESVGQVLEALNDLKQLDNTLIIYSGDNGLLRGEHRRFEKRCMYEESIRLPLIMRYPPLIPRAAKNQALTLNIDLAPTILELAAVTILGNVLGQSMLALFSNPSASWRTSFLYQYQWERGYTVPTTLGLRTDRWSLATYPEIDDIDELYDLHSDPHQLQNLASDSAHAKTLDELRLELQDQIKKCRL